jgi:hypothetical protein
VPNASTLAKDGVAMRTTQKSCVTPHEKVVAENEKAGTRLTKPPASARGSSTISIRAMHRIAAPAGEADEPPF